MDNHLHPATTHELNQQQGTMPKQQRSCRFSCRSLLIAVTILAVLIAATVPIIRQYRLAGQRIHCRNLMASIGLALANYYDVYKKFPCAITYAEDGTPLHSWRTAIMPYITSEVLLRGYSYQEPWNGPANRLLGTSEAICFRCPSAPSTQDAMCTNYVMLIDDRPGQPNGPPNRPGSVPPRLYPDHSVIVIEIADSDIHWMEPRDVLLSELSLKINDRTRRSIASYHGGAFVVHADGSPEMLDPSAAEGHIRALLMK